MGDLRYNVATNVANDDYPIMKLINKSLIYVLLLSVISFKVAAFNVHIRYFPIEHYSQSVSDYLPNNAPNYSKRLLTKAYQQKQLQRFLRHTQGDLSPWHKVYIKEHLKSVIKDQRALLGNYRQEINDGLNHYQQNYRRHHLPWVNALEANMQLQSHLIYNKGNRAIMIKNTLVRELPDIAPDFYHPSIAGEGFPFDTLQASNLWVGTPIYVIQTSKNKQWSLILTPEGYEAWVSSDSYAYTSTSFIKRWRHLSNKALMAFTKSEVTVLNKQSQFAFTAYVGAFLPLASKTRTQISIYYPIKNNKGHAKMAIGRVNKKAITAMPLTANRNNFARLIKSLKGRPYGWGGRYFYNDCSEEMKNLFTPFALWLPRNSSAQSKIAKTIDLSKKSINERLAYLKKHGKPLITLIYVGGHIMLYVGRHDNELISYQNVWGLPGKHQKMRYIIGAASFLPLKKKYEIDDIKSQADKKEFKLIYLHKLM